MYCIYLRKSRADEESEARGEGETLARHKKILLALASKLEINISRIYKEIVSGETIAARPAMQELLRDVEKEVWEGVLVMEIERLARGDTMDQGLVAQTFKYSGTKIITPVKTYDPNDEFDEEYFEFGLFMSRREYKTINRRLQRGRLQSAKEGKFTGNIAPYGYKRKKLESDSGYTLETIEEAKIVVLIYKWYTKERIGVTKIRNRLNEMKVPTRKGGDWTSSTIRNILSNPVYIGKIRQGDRPQVKKIVDGEVVIERPHAKNPNIYEGLHEAIIDEGTFNLAQEYLSNNPPLPIPTKYKTKNPLAGLVICGMCGRKMNRRPYTNGRPSSLICTGPTCPNVSSYLYIVEERLLAALGNWLQNYRLEIKGQKERDSILELEVLKKGIKDIDAELGVLNKQLSKLHDLLEQGVYSVDIFLERSKTLKDRIDVVETNKKELSKKLEVISRKEKSKKVIVPKIEKIVDVYWQLQSPKEKNILLKEVLEKAVYIKKVGGRWHAKPDEFELRVYPKLPQ
ncbi:MAG TPA: recombinase family protein [Clostridiaceae bacterium]|nr:recombinase family protein [Clostridiaceae bacterium]